MRAVLSAVRLVGVGAHDIPSWPRALPGEGLGRSWPVSSGLAGVAGSW